MVHAEKGRWEFEVLVTVIMKCISSSSNYSGLSVVSHPVSGLIMDTIDQSVKLNVTCKMHAVGPMLDL